MRLKLFLIYAFVACFASPMLKSEGENPILTEEIITEETISINEELNNGKIHMVKEGDTLSSISKIYSINIKSLIEANNLSDGNYIYIGQKLIIPENIIIDLNIEEIDSSNYHEVKAGETLTDISLLYGIKLEKLIEINKLEDADSINIGSKIFLDQENIESDQLVIQNEPEQNSDKKYGPLKIISNQIEFKNNRQLLNATNQKGVNIIISLNCDKKELDVRAKGRQWKGWLPAEKEFEKDLLNDFCELRND